MKNEEGAGLKELGNITSAVSTSGVHPTTQSVVVDVTQDKYCYQDETNYDDICYRVAAALSGNDTKFHADVLAAMLNREIVQDSHLAQLLTKQGAFYVVFLDRSDSGFWRENAQGNARYMARLRHPPVLLLQAIA